MSLKHFYRNFWMNILLKSAKIIDPTSSFHGNTLDILIRNGTIDKIDKTIDAPKASVIEHKNLFVCDRRGTVRIRANACDTAGSRLYL